MLECCAALTAKPQVVHAWSTKPVFPREKLVLGSALVLRRHRSPLAVNEQSSPVAERIIHTEWRMVNAVWVDTEGIRFVKPLGEVLHVVLR